MDSREQRSLFDGAFASPQSGGGLFGQPAAPPPAKTPVQVLETVRDEQLSALIRYTMDVIKSELQCATDGSAVTTCAQVVKITTVYLAQRAAITTKFGQAIEILRS